MENYIKGLIYAHKEEISFLYDTTPGERQRKRDLTTRIKELEAILECEEQSRVTVIRGGALYGR